MTGILLDKLLVYYTSVSNRTKPQPTTGQSKYTLPMNSRLPKRAIFNINSHVLFGNLSTVKKVKIQNHHFELKLVNFETADCN